MLLGSQAFVWRKCIWEFAEALQSTLGMANPFKIKGWVGKLFAPDRNFCEHTRILVPALCRINNATQRVS